MKIELEKKKQRKNAAEKFSHFLRYANNGYDKQWFHTLSPRSAQSCTRVR